MKIGIHITSNKGLSAWTQKYISILDYNNIEWVFLSISDQDFWLQLEKCTHFIYHWDGTSDAHQIAHSIFPIVEFEYKIPCFPDWRLTWNYDDKIRGYYLLKSHRYKFLFRYCYFF